HPLRDLPSRGRGGGLGRAVLQHPGRQEQLQLYRRLGGRGRPLPVRRGGAGLYTVPLRPPHLCPGHAPGDTMTMHTSRRLANEEGFALFMVLLLTLVVGAISMSAISLMGNARLINLQGERQMRMEYA